MIDYLKLEQDLKPFYDYKAEKEYKEKIDKVGKTVFYIFCFSVALTMVVIHVILKDLDENFNLFFIIFAVGLAILFVLIMPEIFPKKDFQTNNYETEENLKKFSEFGIKNIANFKENIALLKQKTEYMIFDEKLKKTENYLAKEIYINKILNMFYGTDKVDLEKQDMELLELLKK